MDVKVKKAWVEALRSGKYTQGKQALLDEKGRYCCLGVLCEISPEVEKGRPGYKGGLIPFLFGASRSDAYLPNDFAEVLGISVEAQRTLARMNDGSDDEAPANFNEIADYIEKEF